MRLSPCYYPATIGMSQAEASAITAHHCIELDVALPVHQIQHAFAPFPEDAVTLDRDHNMLAVTVGIYYEDWFNHVDFAALETGDVAAYRQLADNIVASLQAWTDRP